MNIKTSMNNKPAKMPEGWQDNLLVINICWLAENFGTDEYDENGELIFDTDSMSDEILQAYKETVLYQREMRDKGFYID